MRYSDLQREVINEAYVSKVGEHPLVQVFADYDKLSGYLNEDIAFISEFATLLEDDEFDPFSHLIQNDKIDIDKDCVLSIGDSNAKMRRMGTKYFSLPAGYTCPFADVCKSTAHRHGKPYKDGKKIKDFGDFRCYAASGEAQYPNVRAGRWRNLDLLRKHKGDAAGMADLILKSFDFYEREKGMISMFRIHDSGDFFSQEYFDAWLQVAKERSDILFYAYTKSLPFWKARKDDIPKNFRLIASAGGKADEMISQEQFRQAVVLTDKSEAIAHKLNVDVDDFLAAFGEDDFALLLHGAQPKDTGLGSRSRKNSEMMKAIRNMPSSDKKLVARLHQKYTENPLTHNAVHE